jgi:hypothetical protein
MLVLFLLLVIVAIVLGIVGVIAKGLLYPADHRHRRLPRRRSPGRPAAVATRQASSRDPSVRRGVRCGRLSRPARKFSGQLPAAGASAGAVNACRGVVSRLHRLMGSQPALDVP